MSTGIKIVITGDFYSGNRMTELVTEGRYAEIFNDLLPIIKNSDIAITNLESVLTDSEIACSKTGPAMKAIPKTIDALDFAGFNLLTLANNHIMDYGYQGLSDTINLCTEKKIDFCGVGDNLESASVIFYKQVSNTKLAFINIAENEFSTTDGERPGANPLNPVTNFYKIQEARRNSDFVFVIIHGGHEMYELPSPRMKQLYRFFADAGANVIIGHHAHCFSGYEKYNGSYIFYGLGNFVFDHKTLRNSNWNFGIVVQFYIDNKKLNLEILPIEQCNSEPGARILDENGRNEFFGKLGNLNKIIADDTLLSDEFNSFCRRSSASYSAFLEPYSNRFLHILGKKGILPSFLGKRKRLLYLNLIRCESHRELLINILQL